MQAFDSKTFTKERIKSRLLKKAAELWGYQENEVDSFDPLVSLLMDSCSVEFEKIAQEITSTQSRLLNRLANIMNPDVMDIPRPAYGVMQARSNEPHALLSTDTQFIYRRAANARVSATELGSPEVFFTPVVPAHLYNANIKIIATSSSLYEVENGNQKKVLGVAEQVRNGEKVLWLGMDLSSEIKTLDKFLFYFDWQNDPERDRYYQFLPFAKWSVGGHPMKSQIGYPIYVQAAKETNILEDEFDMALKIEQHVSAFYHKCFVQLSMSGLLKDHGIIPQVFPKAMEETFAWQDLQVLKNEYVWIKVQFPDSLPLEALNNLYCYINAFPVINRKMNKLTYRLQQNLNIIPLNANDSFLNIKEVRSANNALYKSALQTNLQELGGETYTLRFQGVDRFDSRNARELLYYLLELLRDEGSAFAALGEDFLTSLIREMNQNIARLEQKLNQSSASFQKAPIPYIVMKPKNVGENIYVEFWTTNGAGANRVPGGSKLSAYSSPQVRNNELYMISPTHGGNERLNAFEKIYSYKKTLLTRNRVVTMEDIRAFCMAQFGNRLRAVEVEKGFITGATPKAGLIRCIKVKLIPRDLREMSKEEWQRSCEELAVVLENHSAANLPYQVTVSE